MKKNLTLYYWKEYKCANCKNLFSGNELLKYSTLWNFNVPICRPCYKEIK